MIKPFEFYFDFASPYTFIAHKEIRKIEKENFVKMKYMPILVGGLLKLSGIKANADIPIKAKYMIKDCKLWAEKYKIIFKFNNYFPINTLNLMRCVLVAEKKDIAPNFIDKVFDVIWKDGLNLNDNIIVEKLLKNLDLNPKTFLMEAVNPVIKDELKRRTDEAYNKGIFGTPSFIVNNKMFWGQDRLEFVFNEARK
ncbi:MAG: 2-hydroxychromene-2-carboxylate isomerase [Pelagibacteraceae bacterium]|jgi:2-hydroxychromene-2-carboxylate isomerase|nr:2-hydroxychromene-2-carboxylate isomerase [Pelagibacteraceae bacterium]MDP6709937.1 2-hydroxychromene-2-carboxylate isomerase [Pelagibacteraceae bacterium]